MDQLHKWGIDKYGHIPNQIKTRQAKLATLKNDIPTHDCIIKIKDMETNQDELLKQEELWWAQRAKAHWLKNGDLNTKYFHKKASQRKRKNTITSIQDHSGTTWQDNTKLHSIFLDYFQNIFDSSYAYFDNTIYDVVNNMISTQDYNFLNIPFIPLEVKEASRNIKADSVPGPDGLTALFNHKY